MIGRARSGTGARASSLEMRPEFGLSVELLETKEAYSAILIDG